MRYVLIASIAVCTLLATLLPVAAGDHYHSENRWVGQSLHSQCDFLGHCSWPYWKNNYHHRPRYSRNHFYGGTRLHHHSHYLHRHRYLYNAYRAYRQPDSDLMEAQLRLRDLGYDVDGDGVWGPQTAHAIRSFQRREGLDVTGELGPRTKAMLMDRDDRHRFSQGPRRGNERYDRDGPRRVAGWRYGGDERDDRRECRHEMIRAYSDQHVWKEADEIARKRWMGAVRAEHGEVYMSWDFAADKKVSCWQSGEGATFAEKAAESLGRAHTRCVAEARPCLVRRDASETDR